MAIQTTIAEGLQDKIDAKAAIKAAIIAKGVPVTTELLSDYASKVALISQDPTIPVGTGQHLVTFYDYNGKVLKRQRVATGGNATAPTAPTHEFLTFAEWNNPFTNVQSDIDTGAIYNTTDGKTYLFITLTSVTGLTPALYFSKSSTSLMTINWGDGTTSTSTTSGNQNIAHTYSAVGNYIITIDNSTGGTYFLGNGTTTTQLFTNSTYKKICSKAYIGSNLSAIGLYAFYVDNLSIISVGSNIISSASFYSCVSLTHINLGSNYGNVANVFYDCRTLKNIVHYRTTTYISQIYNANNIRSIILPASITNILAQAFQNAYSLTKYIFLSTTPPTLANVNSFSGITSICKIYVPDASVAAYKAATNWITYANYIYPLSEKPQSDE